MFLFAFSSLYSNKTLCASVLSIIAYNHSSCILEINCYPWFRLNNYSCNRDICVIRNLFYYRIVWIWFIEQNHAIILYFAFCILLITFFILHLASCILHMYFYFYLFLWLFLHFEFWILNSEL
jgi:hypothetical protein